VITITEAIPKDFKTIQQIAYKTWPTAYGEILSKSQIDFMLESMYALDVLNDNYTKKNHRFLLLNEFENPVGFASYEHQYLNSNATRLHKLYLLPESKSKGFGKLLIDEISRVACENNSDKISLNVNRFNSAFKFYQKMGFEIIGEENLFIGNGYFMEDYKMEKKL
jgi:ribosomal protein S18 acetylase RimI-like enzyme